MSGAGETPLIQINQQNNEVNVGNTASNLNRDSRERVKAAVLGLLDSIANVPAAQPAAEDLVTIETVEGDVNIDG